MGKKQRQLNEQKQIYFQILQNLKYDYFSVGLGTQLYKLQKMNSMALPSIISLYLGRKWIMTRVSFPVGQKLKNAKKKVDKRLPREMESNKNKWFPS